MLDVRTARNMHDFLGILTLQKANLKQGTLSANQKEDGFVTVTHDMDLLNNMHKLLPQIVAVDDGEVVGYALSMDEAVKDHIPVLQPMFEMINRLTFRGASIKSGSFYIMGQVCIHPDYRGQGLFKALYDAHQTYFEDEFAYCITEISSSNQRSIRAHEKVGFQRIHTFTDATDEWNILLWDWS
ncbi:MAG: GNAT family N-acetyltransferase [Bacteroidota bacterium]